MWNPPEYGFLIESVVKSFFHLDRKRKFTLAPMGGEVVYHYIEESEIKSYLELHNTGIDLYYFLKIFYAMDEYYITKYLNKPKKKGR